MKTSKSDVNRLDNAHVTKVLFVCHGNICRSTMAQYVMQYLVEKNGLAESFFIDSAATSTERLTILLTLVRDASFSRREFIAAIIAPGSSRAKITRTLITSLEWITTTCVICCAY